MKPIEIRVNRHCHAGTRNITTYTLDVVYPGVGNVVNGTVVHKSFVNAKDWCNKEWPGVPVLRNY